MPREHAEQLHQRLLATFQVEAAEHLGIIGSTLESVAGNSGSGDTADRLALLFRTMHTLKGAARSVGLSEIERLCQLCEALLRDLTEGRIAVDPAIVRSLQEACDAVAALMNSAIAPERLDQVANELQVARERAASAGATASPARRAPAARQAAALSEGEVREPPPAAETASEAVRPASAEAARLSSIRVEVSRLDRLNVVAEDLLIPKLAAGEGVRAARAIVDTVTRLREGLRDRRAAREMPRGDHALARIDDGLRDVEVRLRQLSATLRGDHRILRGAVDSLFEEIRQIRMMPAAGTLEAFPRMVRDLARETRKEVAWRLSGADIEIDRKILDLVKDPLIHLVRNAVDHGIEAPDERARLGKPRQGTVCVAIEQVDGGRVAIEVADDGRGLNRAAIRNAAVRSRVLTSEQAATVGDDEIVDLAFRAGVSTSPVITRISGHGLGLAIVRECIERVDGHVTVRSSPGAGTAIRIDLPATIATYRGLLVGCGGTRLLWPIESVERAIGVPHRDVSPSLARGAYEFGGKALPFGRLSTILGLRAGRQERDERARVPAIVVRGAERRGILLVDAVLGERELLIKELRAPMRRVRNIQTAGLLGDGQLVLVVRPSDVLHGIRAGAADETKAVVRSVPRVFRVLVVDDSITTRTMERNLFEAAGYEVGTAADGIEALHMLQNESFDLVVSDVDMPRMDGFTLTERVRADSRLHQLPIVLVTALETREDKERGVRVGANAYVLKSGFNQSNLLEIVHRFI